MLLVETAHKTGLDAAISAAPAPWRKPRTVHAPGKILLDVAPAVALGADCLSDVFEFRAEPAVSRLIDTLAADGKRAWARSAPPAPKYASMSGRWPAIRRRTPTGR